VVKEPQGVLELMEQTEAAWKAEIAAAGKAGAPEREALREELGALRSEYAEADYPRREAIQGELRELIRRYHALPGVMAQAAAAGAAPEVQTEPEPEAAPEAEPQPEVHPEAQAEPEPAPEGQPEPEPEPVPEAVAQTVPEPEPPHGPVPLGGEAQPAPYALDAPEAAPAAPEAPEPPQAPPVSGPRAAAGGTRRPESAPRATGPVPHGAFRPAAAPEPEAEAAPEAGPEPRNEAPDDGSEGWQQAWGRTDSTLRRWWARGRLALEYQVLLKKREERWQEVGVRVCQLGRKDALGSASDDAGVRERLKQVEQVESAIRANRDRWDDLRGPG
jgi:hypothetical protein